MTPDAQYSLINVAYMSTDKEVEREMYHVLKDVTTGGIPHDNPVSGSLHLEHAFIGGGDTEYSRLEHSSAADTHESTSEQQYSFLQDAATPAWVQQVESAHISKQDV